MFLSRESERAMDRLQRLLGTVWESVLSSKKLQSTFSHEWELTVVYPPAPSHQHVDSRECSSGSDSDETISEMTDEESYSEFY